MTARPALVIDSSFLWDLYGIPRGKRVDEEQRQRAKERLKTVIELGVPLFVPFPVVFETANSIAKIKDPEEREKRAERLVSDVEGSVERAAPWIVTPSDGPLFDHQNLLQLCRGFGGENIATGISLVDLFVAEEAQRLKRRLAPGRLVHIWTGDQTLKSREPDPEPPDWWRATGA